MGNRSRRERGAALLTTMVSVAILTAVAVDLAYSSQVSLQIAANGRDELRASYLARSGVSLSRLVLKFQQQVDDTASKAPSMGAFTVPRVRLWALVPVGSTLVEGLFPSDRPRGDAGATSFDARIEDEAQKVNAQLEGYAKTGDQTLWFQVQSLYQLVCDARWDPLFEREDANGVRTTREDLLVRLRDWTDQGDQSSEFLPAGSPGPCAMVPAQPPFRDAYGDENQPYDRGEDRYRAKNAHMDSLDELFMVSGINDAFMAAFGDRLTVYLPVNAKLTTQASDKDWLVKFARSVALNPALPVFQTPEFGDLLVQEIMKLSPMGMFALSAKQIAEVVRALGVPLNPQVPLDGNNSPFTDRSTTFRIRASGKAGAVRSSIDAVVWLEQTQPGTPAGAPGRLVHWREE